MPYYLLSAETTFSAAHVLPGVERCDRLHGHNWRVRLTVRVEEARLTEGGMGVDFRVIEDVTRTAVADFDHGYLNELEPFREQPPTAERIAQVVSVRAADRLAEAAPRVRVEQVEVWEVPHYRVVYRPG
ncbi:MAG: 6-carboxytetrahydropterin synthase QueD [Gemmatimonadales bacterium]|nr:6-carboxytetrahydropterin synthase QueD [Gemmatimonadales bacterium]NIN10459.1 6-carboxytetrahydropterin synthase QueD [Gemmatimonadales bacterium]NIN49251.1 6-carboxytetrahydropterin synthase QueD [Gemmatimonadales bacterium]NIP06715.1 6-carboxytetrahydropterin synthase QueD [Gemmatimonadales bacterium]NIR00046.1 6-carboxytetrahydropterin synthase QueD [Gemmatimonadales bacterium]